MLKSNQSVQKQGWLSRFFGGVWDSDENTHDLARAVINENNLYPQEKITKVDGQYNLVDRFNAPISDYQYENLFKSKPNRDDYFLIGGKFMAEPKFQTSRKINKITKKPLKDGRSQYKIIKDSVDDRNLSRIQQQKPRIYDFLNRVNSSTYESLTSHPQGTYGAIMDMVRESGFDKEYEVNEDTFHPSFLKLLETQKKPESHPELSPDNVMLPISLKTIKKDKNKPNESTKEEKPSSTPKEQNKNKRNSDYTIGDKNKPYNPSGGDYILPDEKTKSSKTVAPNIDMDAINAQNKQLDEDLTKNLKDELLSKEPMFINDDGNVPYSKLSQKYLDMQPKLDEEYAKYAERYGFGRKWIDDKKVLTNDERWARAKNIKPQLDYQEKILTQKFDAEKKLNDIRRRHHRDVNNQKNYHQIKDAYYRLQDIKKKHKQNYIDKNNQENYHQIKDAYGRLQEIKKQHHIDVNNQENYHQIKDAYGRLQDIKRQHYIDVNNQDNYRQIVNGKKNLDAIKDKMIMKNKAIALKEQIKPSSKSLAIQKTNSKNLSKLGSYLKKMRGK